MQIYRALLRISRDLLRMYRAKFQKPPRLEISNLCGRFLCRERKRAREREIYIERARYRESEKQKERHRRDSESQWCTLEQRERAREREEGASGRACANEWDFYVDNMQSFLNCTQAIRRDRTPQKSDSFPKTKRQNEKSIVDVYKLQPSRRSIKKERKQAVRRRGGGERKT